MFLRKSPHCNNFHSEKAWGLTSLARLDENVVKFCLWQPWWFVRNLWNISRKITASHRIRVECLLQVIQALGNSSPYVNESQKFNIITAIASYTNRLRNARTPVNFDHSRIIRKHDQPQTKIEDNSVEKYASTYLNCSDSIFSAILSKSSNESELT
jgi:hypothetical protein